MTKMQKLTVSLTPSQMRLLKRRAGKTRTPAAVLEEALAELARREAQERLIKSLGKAAELSDDEYARITAEWQG